MKIIWILLIIYISILLLTTFGIKAILKVEKIEKPNLLVLFIVGLLWPVLLLVYIVKFVYKAIKSAFLRI